MKYCAFAFLVGSLSFFPAANAGNDGEGSMSVGGSAPAVCSFRAAPRQLSGTNMNLAAVSLQSGQITVTELIDESTARLKAASIQIEMLGICNRPHHLTLMTNRGGLAPEGEVIEPGGSFSRHVNYRAEALWGGQSVILLTDATPGKKSSPGLVNGANDGALNLRVIIDGTTNDMASPTASGVYSDSLIIQIGLPL